MTIHRGLSLFAMASTAIGAAAVAPAVAHAAAPAAATHTAPLAASAVPATDLPTCGGGTRIDLFDAYAVVPSVGVNDRNYGCTFGRGNVSSAVLKVQQALNRCYGAGIAEDQVFGPQTESALRAAQRQEGIFDDGVYGPQTATHLQWPFYQARDNVQFMCGRFPFLVS
ncbi:MAG TPA: peptidoglycan-binding domain-containing protein [Candidatus Limnocylindria bacterium]|nr:peptidoglycan-binding domain-containing protein [Candidatus Limnocylindria bacterium]